MLLTSEPPEPERDQPKDAAPRVEVSTQPAGDVYWGQEQSRRRRDSSVDCCTIFRWIHPHRVVSADTQTYIETPDVPHP